MSTSTYFQLFLVFWGVVSSNIYSCFCRNFYTTFGTYNTFQFPGSEAAASRAELQIPELLSSYNDIDILCLQEIYFYTEKESYISGLSSLYPYSASENDYWATEESGDSDLLQLPRKACNNGDTANEEEIYNALISDCAITYCSNNYEQTFGNAVSLVACLAAYCPVEYEILQFTECFFCMLTIGGSLNSFFLDITYNNALYVCNDVELNYQFKGQDDTIILSKYPIINRYFFDLPKNLVPIGLNIAQISISEDNDDDNEDSNEDNETSGNDDNNNDNNSKNKNIYVVCSHYQATGDSQFTLSDINPSYQWANELEYGFSTPEELNAIQIEMTLDIIKNDINYNENDPIIWLGDFNVGKLAYPENFEIAISDNNGFSFKDMTDIKYQNENDDSAYTSVECTWCPYEPDRNKLVSLSSSSEGNIDVDHILIHSGDSNNNEIVGISGSRILMDEFYMQDINEYLDENTNKSALSDHYGLKLMLKIKD